MPANHSQHHQSDWMRSRICWIKCSQQPVHTSLPVTPLTLASSKVPATKPGQHALKRPVHGLILRVTQHLRSIPITMECRTRGKKPTASIRISHAMELLSPSTDTDRK